MAAKALNQPTSAEYTVCFANDSIMNILPVRLLGRQAITAAVWGVSSERLIVYGQQKSGQEYLKFK
jgi:hypothetical protein